MHDLMRISLAKSCFLQYADPATLYYPQNVQPEDTVF